VSGLGSRHVPSKTGLAGKSLLSCRQAGTRPRDSAGGIFRVSSLR
jgi:hypothetical protein